MSKQKIIYGYYNLDARNNNLGNEDFFKFMKICVNGSRTFKNYQRLEKELDTRLGRYDISSLEIVSGGAEGADKLVEEYCRRSGIRNTVIPAEWTKYGKPAGMIRNKIMIGQCQALISFWDGVSKGTKHTIDYAKSQGILVDIIRISLPKDV